MKKVSIIIPVIRPDNVPSLVETITRNAGIPATHFEVITVEDTERIGCPKMVKKLAAMARFKLVAFIGDDTEPQPGFLKQALKVMRTMPDGWGLVGFNDEFHDGNLATHWLADKRLLKHLGGEFFHTGYKHTWCDVELTERCKALNRYRYAKKAVIRHNHPIIQKDAKLDDKDYQRVYSDEYRDHDENLYIIRRRSKWVTPAGSPPPSKNKQVAICIPSASQGKAQFWMDLEKMRYHSLVNGVDTARKRRTGAIVEHARNMLVRDILKDYKQCTHILFVDDDMSFDEDLLIRLLSHDKDMVVANAHRKYPPYIPVVSIQKSDDEFFAPVYIPPAEGTLRRVTSAGTGVALIKVDVFKKMKFPWFKSEYVPAAEEDKDNPVHCMGYMFVSEDNRFFIIAQELGFKLYCDFSLEIGHIGDHIATWRDYERCKEENERNQTDNEGADPDDGRDRDKQHHKPGVEGRSKDTPEKAQLPIYGSVNDDDGGGQRLNL